jgi:ADP-heptose:LPS heptosyltransferase
VCDEERYRFFESRAYGGAHGGTTPRALPQLAADWAGETLGVADAKPFVALAEPPEHGSHIAISLGVGGNHAKRIPDPFEENLLHLLARAGLELWIDRGAGGEEAERVTRAVERSGASARFWDGSFAGFARIIAGARQYLGYDSAGQHVAAACGIPSITIFAGFPTPRMFDRWRPIGEHATVLRVDRPDSGEVLERVRGILRLTPSDTAAP